MTDIAKSIKAINQDAQFVVDAEDINKITWYNNTTPISKEDILAKQVELKAEYEAKQYQRDRTKEPSDGGYPYLEDQMDMMWHDKKDGTTTWEDAVQATKDKYPKP